jgi:hypothetical protein
MTHVPLRRRSLLARIVYAPRAFVGHYRILRICGHGVITSAQVAALFTRGLFG